MKKFGLIGHPIESSKSPLLFKAGYSGKYVYDLIEGEDFNKSYNVFLEQYDGINVTAPFKEHAAAMADIKTDIVTKTGAANLLVKTEEGIVAHNTDYCGIILAVIDGILPEGGFGYYSLYGRDLATIKRLVRTMYSARTPKALIVGCGGAGKAACAAAAGMGYTVTLMNRTLSKAYEIAKKMPEHNFTIADIEDFVSRVRESDLIIYTIPGKIPQIDDLRREDLHVSNKIILEANYKNPVLKDIVGCSDKKCKCRYISGRRWLLYQALTGYGIFTGENPNFERMNQEL